MLWQLLHNNTIHFPLTEIPFFIDTEFQCVRNKLKILRNQCTSQQEVQKKKKN